MGTSSDSSSTNTGDARRLRSGSQILKPREEVPPTVLVSRVRGIPPGTAATFEIFPEGREQPEHLVATVNGEVTEGGEVRGEWDSTSYDKEAVGKNPRFVFKMKVEGPNGTLVAHSEQALGLPEVPLPEESDGDDAGKGPMEGSGQGDDDEGAGKGNGTGSQWFEVRLQSPAGRPLVGIKYRLAAPGEIREGLSDADGRIRVDNLQPGSTELMLQTIRRARFEPNEAQPGQSVKLCAEARGFEPGTQAEFEILSGEPEQPVGTASAGVMADGKVEATWEAPTRDQGKADAPAPTYRFKVTIDEVEARSRNALRLTEFVEWRLKSPEGEPLAGAPIQAQGPDGSHVYLQADAEGVVRVPKQEVGRHALDVSGFQILRGEEAQSG